jgi:large repetitive protein
MISLSPHLAKQAHRSRTIPAILSLLFFMPLTVFPVLAATTIDLSVSSYTWTPDPVIRGASSAFTSVATNNDASITADNLTLVIQLPANINFGTAATTTPSGCSFNLAADPKILTCTRAALAAMAPWSVSFTGIGLTSGTQDTTAAVSAQDNTDPNNGNDSLTKPTTVINGADLSIQKTGPASTTAGSTISFTIGISNGGPDPATTFRMTDNLPAAVDFAFSSATGAGWSCSQVSTTVTCDYSGTAVPSGSSAPDITITGRVITTAGSITNGASVASTDGNTGDPVAGNNGPSQAVVIVNPGTDIQVNKTMVSATTGMTSYATGEAVTLTLSATNQGPQNAMGVTITDAISSDFSIGTLPGGCSAVGQTITCTVGALNNGVTSSSFVIPLTIVGAAGNSGTNTANVTRSAPAGGANNAASVNYSISAPFAHLTIAKTKSPNPVAAGSNITNTVTVTNSDTSTSAATGTIRVTDVLDINETFVSYSGSGWSCSGVLVGETGTVTCDYAGANLARGASLPVLAIITQATPGYLGSITNTACTGQSAGSPHTPSDNSSAGNCQSRTVTGTYRNVDLSITKSSSTSLVLITDSNFYYTLTIANAGPDIAPTASVTDALNAWYSGDAGTTSGSAVITGAGAGESCSFGSTVYCTLRNVANGAPRTITISLNRPFRDGSINNTATVSTPDAIDTVPGNNSASASLTIDPLADAAVTSISAAPDPVRVGVQLTFTTSIKNNGPSAAAGVVLRHVIDPSMVTYVTGTASLTLGGSCSYASSFTGAPFAGQAGIECSGFSLSNGESRQLSFKVIPNYPYPGGAPNTYSSSAYITTTTPETDAPGYANNGMSKTVNVVVDALDLTVADNDPGYDPTAFGDSIVYQIKVQNNGPSQATAFALTVTPTPAPQGSALNPYTMNYNAAGSTLPSGATCAPSGSDIVCYLGAGAASSYLAPNTNQTFNLRFDTGPLANVPSGSLTYRTIATVSSNESLALHDSLPGNNSVTETTTVLPKTDLILVSKTVSKPTVDINEPFTYTVTIGNKGPSDVSGMRVTDPLPAGFVMTGGVTVTPGASVSLTANTCTIPAVGSNGTIDCTLGPLPADASGADATKQVVLTIPVRAAYQSSGSYSFSFNTNIANTATASVLTGVSLDPDGSNNSKTVNVQVRRNSIAGTAYADNNRNNTIDAGEGINSVTLTLTGADSYGNTYQASGGTYPVITTTSPASGSTGIFTFTTVPPGTWTIVETQPAAYYDVFETAGSAGGTVPPATCDGTNNCSSIAAHNTISAISLPADTATAATGYIFQEYWRAQITGFVYHDANNDGNRGAGETTGVGSQSITLSGTAYNGVSVCTIIGAGSCTITTIASGLLSYGILPPSDATGYTVTQNNQPSGYLPGKSQNGAGVANVVPGSAGVAAPKNISGVVLTPGLTASNRNFGELLPATISGYVFLDADANAVRGAGETSGLTGITITLAGTDDLSNAVGPTTATTAASGIYSFAGLRPGSYTVTETPPTGVTHTGAQAGAYGGDIAGSTRTAGTGVPGAGNVNIINIPIASNNSATGYNFGESGQGLSGYVYVDSNTNGIMDAGESGISGVQITLSGNTGTSVNVCTAISPNPCTVTTNSSGIYSFSVLPASDGAGYTASEQSQASAPLNNYSDGTDNVGTVNSVVRGSAAVKNILSGITLALGENAINYNFGELAAKLSGTVYYDANNDGTKGGSEAGIPGVTVAITGTSISGVAVSHSATTDASGSFNFTDLLAANGTGYTLTVTQPPNYADGKKTAGTSGGTANAPGVRTITGIALAGGATATGYLFGETLGSLSGTVYYDANNDGTKLGASELGISGVTVTLSGTAASGVNACTLASCAAVTDSNGSFAFSELPGANGSGYTLTITQPSNYADGKKTAGTSGGTAGAPGLRTITAIAFSSGANAAGYYFGETLGSLTGTVYYDANNDGTKLGATELGLSGVTVTLSGAAASAANVCTLANCVAVTDSNGNFIFTELPGADGSGYTLTVTQPTNYADGKKIAGTSAGITGAPGVRTVTGIAFASGANATGYFFGETLGSLTGTVYYDANNDGAKLGASETGISSVTVSLSGTDLATGAAVSKTAATDSNGSYSFTELPASSAAGYTLTVTRPLNYADGKKAAGTSGGTAGTPGVQTITAIAFTAGINATGYLFGETLGSLSGTVYYDANNNGINNAGEPGISGVSLTLSGTDASGGSVSMTTATDSSGNFTFSDLPASNGSGFTLTESQPVTYADGLETTGNLGGTTGAPGSSIISAIAFPAGSTGTGYLFGERLGGLMGIVYVDSNNNGARDTGEIGIGNVTLTLTGIDAGGSSLNRTTTSASDGTYSFTDLPTSNGTGYTLTESQPAGYLDGLETPGTRGGMVGTPGTSVISAIVYPADANATGYLFGEIAGGMSGSVYYDANNNGIIDSGETGIAGVTITLTGTDADGASVNQSTTTASDGTYSFVNLPASNGAGYSLTETQPVNYLDGRETAGSLGGTVDNGSFTALPAQNTISAIPFAAGADATGYLFGERLGSLSGVVYHDANSNGVKDAGENGIAGVTITLTGTDASGATVNRTTITASDGTYGFTDLPAANGSGYALTETQPLIYLDGRETAGSLGGTVDNGSFTALPAQNTISAIPFAAGANGAGYIFGERLGSLSGAVYYDANSNGIRDGGETGIANVTLALTGTDAGGTAVNRSAITASDGTYSFANLPASNGAGYALAETQPVNYLDGRETAGSLGGTVDNGSFTAAPAQNTISTIVFPPGADGTGYLFAERLGRLSGVVYYDVNNSGAKDNNEAGIASVTITLTGTDASGAAVNRSTTTAPDGTYSFADIPASNSAGYTLTETQPVNYSDGIISPGSAGGTVGINKITAIHFSAGVIATNYLFGERLGGLSGHVYIDLNNDGVKDAGENGIAGVTINLAGTDASGSALNQSATTASDGSFYFADMPNANSQGYILTETQPSGYLDGKLSKGLIDGVECAASDITVYNQIASIPYDAARTFTSFNFGELQSAGVAGSVYLDRNGNGTRDEGEPGIAVVTITLSGADDRGTAVKVTTTTETDGTYAISNLRPSGSGGYTLTETQPPGYGDLAGTSGTKVGSIGGIAIGTAGLNTVTAIVLNSGNSGTGYDFGDIAGGFRGAVYLDNNNSGTMDEGEPGIPGVAVTLTGMDDTGATTNLNTLTAGDGSFTFSLLMGGTYTLTETQPVIYADGKESPGNAGGVVDNSSFTFDPAQNRISGIKLVSGASVSGYLFGERPGLMATVSGTIWFNSIAVDKTQQPGEPGLAGWIVQAVQGGVIRGTATSGTDGKYQIANLPTGTGYELRFFNPGSGALFGDPVSQDPNYRDSVIDLSRHTIANLTLRSGANVINQDLPVDPSGVVYNSVTRQPVSGATVTISGPAGFDPANHLAGGTANLTQTTDATGFYQFLLLSEAPAGNYALTINAPPGYSPGTSSMIPPAAGPFDPGPGPGSNAIQAQSTAPNISQSTLYYLSFELGEGKASIINNHIPVDPVLSGAIAIQKSTPMVNVAKGDLVPYTITVTNVLSTQLADIDVHDKIPPGFKYKVNSATINGIPAPPAVTGRDLAWRNLTFSAGERKVFKLVLVVGTGIGDGKYTNEAWAVNNIVNTTVSNRGAATVRVIPEQTFDCTDVIGRVFDDSNANGYQDKGEPGLPNIRIVTARGLLITSDGEGRFHVPCAVIPDSDRGSNFVMKLDERTLPAGYRMTTENPQAARATRGKMVKINFGAGLYRVVRIDLADAAFESGRNNLMPQWLEKIVNLDKTLQEKPSILRIGYSHGKETRELAKDRIEAVEKLIREQWKKAKHRYELVIESEIEEVR